LLLALSACTTPDSAPGWPGGIEAFNKAIAACEANQSVNIEVCMRAAGYVRAVPGTDMQDRKVVPKCSPNASASRLRKPDCWGIPGVVNV